MRALARRARAELGGLVTGWWQGEAGLAGQLLGALLWPAELAYRGVVACRNAAYDAGLLRPARPLVPVVSIGNLTVGGSGKTPVAAWVARSLAELGESPAIVLRGYGRDEILVHQELNPDVPVFADPRRSDAIREARLAGCGCVVMDDGFQHRRLARDLDIALVAAETWEDRRRLLPRGPWREGPAALKRADLVMITRKISGRTAAEEIAEKVLAIAPGCDVVICRLAPGRLVPLWAEEEGAEPIEALTGCRVLAVTSLADPRPFLSHLRQSGAEVEEAAFPDHHEFTSAEAAQLVRRAAGAPMIMTRKEAVKLRPLLSPSVPAMMLEQVVEIERGLEILEARLREALRGRE
jgi:tetraacyldisaccharide 4'-kinase